MDISRAPNDKKLYLCKWYFRSKSYFSGNFSLFTIHLSVPILINSIFWSHCSWFCIFAICLAREYDLVLQWSIQKAWIQWAKTNKAMWAPLFSFVVLGGLCNVHICHNKIISIRSILLCQFQMWFVQALERYYGQLD